MYNITKTTKVYALFAIIPLLLAGFSGSSFAETTVEEYSSNTVEFALDAIEPYVTINEKKIIHLDVSSAKKNGLNNETLKIAKEYIRIQNKMVQGIHDDSTKQMTISEADGKKFKKFHDKVKNQGIKNNIITSSYLDFLLPQVEAVSCNYNGPHSQPSVYFTGSYTSAQNGINDLPSSYDEVSWYASAFTHDYHDWIVAYDCADGVFRYQTSIVGSGTSWEHRESHSPGEPNPEVLEYSWPVWWWGGYVYDWHDP